MLRERERESSPWVFCTSVHLVSRSTDCFLFQTVSSKMFIQQTTLEGEDRLILEQCVDLLLTLENAGFVSSRTREEMLRVQSKIIPPSEKKDKNASYSLQRTLFPQAQCFFPETICILFHVTGVFFRRHRIPLPPPNDDQFYTVYHFNINIEIVFYGWKFKIYNCDSFTGNFLKKVGIKLNPPGQCPEDPYIRTRKEVR